MQNLKSVYFIFINDRTLWIETIIAAAADKVTSAEDTSSSKMPLYFHPKMNTEEHQVQEHLKMSIMGAAALLCVLAQIKIRIEKGGSHHLHWCLALFKSSILYLGLFFNFTPRGH